MSKGRPKPSREERKNQLIAEAVKAIDLFGEDELERYAGRLIKSNGVKCDLCGQVITDGKPCGCGARK